MEIFCLPCIKFGATRAAKAEKNHRRRQKNENNSWRIQKATVAATSQFPPYPVKNTLSVRIRRSFVLADITGIFYGFKKSIRIRTIS
jgi:hypothetical protein